ncbi:MAG: ATP-binding protein [Candidatus Poribacteria bacterium]|nr:ATP-binding protein [Candidatus Poribacteria bacterium]
MRVTNIEIKNFRAFYGTFQINLDKSGKNLLVYGENGSGKSSLYLALKSFLESSEGSSTRFEDYQNIFRADDGYIKFHLRLDPGAKEHVYEWSRAVNETDDQLIIDASKAKGFLDYRALLETHYIHRENDIVDVFDLLIENLLANVVSDVTGQGIREDWQSVLEARPSRRNART